jgi:aminomethyltransferase
MEPFVRTPIHAMQWFDEQQYGRMQMTGADALPLLHRLTTNHMLQLAPGHSCPTVLTTPIGRSMDLLMVVNDQPAVWVFTSSGQGPMVYTHLKKNIFFNDKVTLAPAAQSHRQYTLYGEGATAWLSAQTGIDVSTVSIDGVVRWHDTVVMRTTPLGGDGWRILEPVAASEGILPRSSVPQMDAATLSLWQLEAGVPAFGSEIGTDYIPLETGLEAAIHTAKGCYVGQEIIARMESRGRRAKTLERITLGGVVATPAPLLTASGREAGVVTRAAHSDALGVIGFAYISTKIEDTEELVCADVAVNRLPAQR